MKLPVIAALVTGLALGGVATAVALVIGAGVAAPAIAAEQRDAACEASGR